jgi:Ca2+-binding EF-hand superfamily protein
MRRLLFLLSAFGLTAVAVAQPPFGGPPDPNAIFNQLDRDGDGKLSATEIPPNLPPPIRALVSSADKNGDGAISRDEFLSGLPGGPGGGPGGGPRNGPGGPGGPVGGHRPVQRPPQLSSRDADKIFRRLDENHDGKITTSEVPEEYRTALEGMIAVADKSRDNALTKAEFRSALKEMPEAGAQLEEVDPKLIFQQMDRNGDGRVTSDEVPQEHRQLFDRLLKDGDKDGDGALSRKEFTAALTAAHKRTAADVEKPPTTKKKSASRAGVGSTRRNPLAGDSSPDTSVRDSGT